MRRTSGQSAGLQGADGDVGGQVLGAARAGTQHAHDGVGGAREPGAAGRIDRHQGRGLLLAQRDEPDVGEPADVVGVGGWLMPTCSASSPTETGRPATATACSSRTRVGSARQANQSAKVAASCADSVPARSVGSTGSGRVMVMATSIDRHRCLHQSTLDTVAIPSSDIDEGLGGRDASERR
jgi:hypothetical protein